MPAKNRIKTYVSDSYYHIYNRGVEKRTIFEDDNDYTVFLACLKLYLNPPKPIDRRFSVTLQGPSPTDTNTLVYAPCRQPNNHYGKIELVAYCLMPNHFHLCIKQTEKRDMDHFMRSLSTKYAMYFNKKYERVGSLFQGRYKAVLIETEEQFTYLTKYIHRNPLALTSYKDRPRQLGKYSFSSYPNYLGARRQNWINPTNILSYFSEKNRYNSYQSFVEESISEIENEKNITLE